MVAAKVKAATAILASGVNHPANVCEAAMNTIVALRKIAERRNAIADIATILARSDCPTHDSIAISRAIASASTHDRPALSSNRNVA